MKTLTTRLLLAISTLLLSSVGLAQYGGLSAFRAHEDAAVQWDQIANQSMGSINYFDNVRNRDRAIRMALESISGYGALSYVNPFELNAFANEMKQKENNLTFTGAFELRRMYRDAGEIARRALDSNVGQPIPQFPPVGGFPGQILPPQPVGPVAVDRRVQCSSDNMQTRLCGSGLNRTLEAPVLVRQISNSACIQGDSFKILSNNQVEVSKGCRAIFKFVGITQSPTVSDSVIGRVVTSQMECASQNLGPRTCGIAGTGRILSVAFTRQISQAACIEGSSFSIGENQISVSNGCRAIFTVERVRGL